MLLRYTLASDNLDHGDFVVDADMIYAVIDMPVPKTGRCARLMLRNGMSFVVSNPRGDAAERWSSAAGELIHEETDG